MLGSRRAKAVKVVVIGGNNRVSATPIADRVTVKAELTSCGELTSFGVQRMVNPLATQDEYGSLLQNFVSFSCHQICEEP